MGAGTMLFDLAVRQIPLPPIKSHIQASPLTAHTVYCLPNDEVGSARFPHGYIWNPKLTVFLTSLSWTGLT